MDFKPAGIGAQELKFSNDKDYNENKHRLKQPYAYVEHELEASDGTVILEKVKVEIPKKAAKMGAVSSKKTTGKAVSKPKTKKPVSKAKKTTTGGTWSSCASKHPKLSLGKGLEIQGGSCTRREPHGEWDVFVALDAGYKKTEAGYPWNTRVEFLFCIQDMSVPKSIDDFNSLLGYLEHEVRAGKSVFVGCIGGHGRTGLVLSALVNRMLGIKDATTYVRKHYCHKAVESVEQVDWLNKHYGIKKVKPTKQWGAPQGSQGFSGYTGKGKAAYATGWSGDNMVTPVDAPGKIFGNLEVS